MYQINVKCLIIPEKVLILCFLKSHRSYWKTFRNKMIFIYFKCMQKKNGNLKGHIFQCNMKLLETSSNFEAILYCQNEK